MKLSLRMKEMKCNCCKSSLKWRFIANSAGFTTMYVDPCEHCSTGKCNECMLTHADNEE